MQFSYSKENLTGSDAQLQRALEMLPGILSWTTLITMVLMSIFYPFTAAIITISFYLCWLMRLLYMTFFLVLSYIQLNMQSKTDWMARAEELPNFDNIYHLVLFPVIKEDAQVIDPAVHAICMQLFPAKKIIVVFALEERAEANIKRDVHATTEKYRHQLFDCFTVIHPANTPGEARVKGANVTCAARKAADYLREHNIPFENVIVSCFDADTVVSKDYFACLTYHFMVTPNRQRASFQPIPVYHNNIWQVPGFARVIEAGSSFFQLIEATNPEKLVTFSSHSMSFKALVEVNYWPVDMISDDSAIFWKCYIHYDGDYHVIPMYVTLSMDVVSSDSWIKTVESVYKQKRRWAWGVENLPLVFRAFLKSDKIPLWDRLRHGFKLLEGHVSWATWGFLLSIIGWMPILFARREFASSVVYYNVPEIANTIFNLASLCLLTSIILSLSLLPKTEIRYSGLKKIAHALEWLLLPIILVIFGALPALHAQTRLMTGRYLEFWVTDKHRKK